MYHRWWRTRGTQREVVLDVLAFRVGHGGVKDFDSSSKTEKIAHFLDDLSVVLAFVLIEIRTRDSPGKSVGNAACGMRVGRVDGDVNMVWVGNWWEDRYMGFEGMHSIQVAEIDFSDMYKLSFEELLLRRRESSERFVGWTTIWMLTEGWGDGAHVAHGGRRQRIRVGNWLSLDGKRWDYWRWTWTWG